ncbi:ATPase synthesis protein mitochondrial [Colletotrichum sojae]|uniref:ATPase synthesis protein 25 n=1 Tax=Colletotrichum sojae TaxID=2175907 RepID=A0A8H6JQP2_9PEZI|nr:ATPase synthesis protein mitochondrial [Colletotrichum sojae]
MASRPAFAVLGCLQCRSRILGAIASNSNTLLRAPALVAPSVCLPRNVHRVFSSVPPDAPKTVLQPPAQGTDAETKPALEANEVIEEDTQADEEVPWFLEVEPPTHAPTQHVSPLPELPEASPAILEPLLKYVYDEMGLDDLSLLDLRNLDPPPAMGPGLMMLFATARSERHLHVSSSRLVKWLRHTHKIESDADGLIGPGELKTKLRRMRRKAKLLGSSAIQLGGDDGISTGWICINLGTIGTQHGEGTRFDADGKMSGFGTSVSGGSTIVVQVMTQERRDDLQLEKLWTKQLERSEAEAKQLQESELPPPTVRTGKGSAARPMQKRYFSTSAARPMSSAAWPPTTTPDGERNPRVSHQPMSLAEVRQQVEEIRWEGGHAAMGRCLFLLQQIFRAASDDANHSEIQADLAAELIGTMHERGLPVMDHEVIITIIEAIAASGACGEKIDTVQYNLELVLLRGVKSCPEEGQLIRLMTAYASQGQWDKFWDVWRMPARYRQRRGPELYIFVFTQMSRTGDKTKCINALRTCAAEMLAEEPPVLPSDRVMHALKLCMHVADPGAEYAVNHMDANSPRTGNRPASPEFMRMLKELEDLRRAM